MTSPLGIPPARQDDTEDVAWNLYKEVVTQGAKAFQPLFEASGYRGCYEIEVWSRDLWKRDHRSLIRECMLRFAHVMTTPT